MKKLLLLSLFITGFLNAQIVNIPDANFKAKLLSATPSTYVASDIAGNNMTLDSNMDGEIQVSEALQVYGLILNSSNISDATGLEYFANLTSLSFYENNLSTLNLSTLINLVHLRCDINQIVSLDFTGLNNLESLNCRDNQLTSLDLSGNPNFYSLFCGINNLTTINVKNGLVNLQPDTDWVSNPNLQFVCVDDGEQANAISNTGNLPNIVVSSYCSFTPGGNFNTISGILTFDANEDGCSASDFNFSNIKISIYDGISSGSTFTNVNGSYSFYTDAGTFDVTPILENPTLFNVNPSTTNINFADNNNNTSNDDFCISPMGVHPDLEVVIAPVKAAPGFNSNYWLIVRNKGNQMISGDLSFTFENDFMDIEYLSSTPDVNVTGNLQWNSINILPFETVSKQIIFQLNSPTDPSFPVNIGDILAFEAIINPIATDEMPADNTFNLNQTVVGAFDPNDKTCLEGDIADPTMIGEYLHYNINFENTGTAAATFVVVKDVIDETQFDMETLQLMYASHPMETRITGNKVEFIFDNINLGPDEKGNVVFKIKTKNTLSVGDSVTNKADIFFDYNFPIVTNDAVTTFQTLSVGEFELDNSVKIFPNPSKDIVTIKSNTFIKSVGIYDLQGRIVTTKVLNESNPMIDISGLNSGVYFLKIRTEVGGKVEKLIKQ